MSHNLNSLQGVLEGIMSGTDIGAITRDSRSLDCKSDTWRFIGLSYY